MADSELLIQKRAQLKEARLQQVIAQEREQRYEQGRPYLDGRQIDTLDVVTAWVRGFPHNFHPSPDSTQKFYEAIQNYMRVTAVPAFTYGSITFPISAESQFGRRGEGWLDKLQPIFSSSREQSLRHIETGFKAAVQQTNFNILWPNIVNVLLDGPLPGPGHIDAAN